DVVAPYSPTDKGTGRGFARCSNSLSTSKERQTATRAPLGQVLGVSFLPTLAVATACRICSSVESTVIGLTAAAGGCRDDGAGWALGELQPGSNPISTPGTTPACRLREDSMLVSLSVRYCTRSIQPSPMYIRTGRPVCSTKRTTSPTAPPPVGATNRKRPPPSGSSAIGLSTFGAFGVMIASF